MTVSTGFGCNVRQSQPGPSIFEKQYAAIERMFLSGELIDAQHSGEEMLEQCLDLAPSQLSKLRIEVGKVYLYQGRSEQAAVLLRQGASYNSGRDLEISRLLLLVMAELRLHHTADAERDMKAAVLLNPNDELYLELRDVQGAIYLEDNQFEEAKVCFRSVIDESYRRRYSFLESRTAINLGVVALEQERYEDALEMFRRAELVANSIGANLLKEKAIGNLGRTFYKVGDLIRASQNTNIAAAQAGKLGATFDEISWLTNAGLVQFAEQDIAAAENSFERALALAQSTNALSLQLHANIALSYLYMRSQPYAVANHLAEAERLVRLLNDPIEEAETQLLRALLFKHQERSTEAEAILLKLVQRPREVASFRWEAENTLAVIYDSMGRERKAERWYARAIATFHLQRLTLKSVESELPFLENGSDLYMGYMEHLIRAGRTGEALRLLDTSRAGTLAEGLGVETRKPRRVGDSRALARRLDATVLVYCLRPERSYLWAITGKRQRFYTLAGSGAILPLVARHNEAILGAKDLLAQKDALGSTGRALYDALLLPAAPLLPKDGGRVVLVADGALSRLNFETLIAPGDPAKGETPHYWIEDASVTNARSLGLLAVGGQPRLTASKPQPKMLLIGDPVYVKGEYATLPNAGAEMAGIAEHFAPAERLVASGRDASPEAYPASRPGRFRFLHFVAHATASELNPLDSAVILSGGGSSVAGATNKLYASEILKQPLSAELVTLSSCYSSGTRNYTGEGVVGLAWAFLRAGAHSVIGALWEVSDVSTPKLMDTMYTRLLAGDAPDAALRAAKLEMLHSDGVFRKPVYWGAFQLYAGR